mmetsp:Transcript_31833/g.69660  ORF Transcript_31833/g.69660 Transcript_31833/m.69660 type:complete len:209 (+) Transcript_31833:794-1420(+)
MSAQSVHWSPRSEVVFFTKPVSHIAQSTAPSADQAPAAQTRHSLMPFSGWYCPSLQGTHWLMPVTGEILPASHSSHTIEPGVAEKRPAGQGVHTSMLCPPLNGLYVPAGHTRAVAFVLPSGQKCPAAHAPSHCPSEKPLVEPNRPAKQNEETDDPAAAKEPAGAVTQSLVVARLILLEKVPASQATGVREPSGQAKPGGQGRYFSWPS